MVNKVQERLFAEEAAALLGIDCEIVDIVEPPDFEIKVDDDAFGLEIRQVFADDEAAYGSPSRKTESDRQMLLRAIAKNYYRVGGAPAHVKVVGTLRHDSVDKTVRALLRSRPEYRGRQSLIDDVEVRVADAKLFVKPLPESFGHYSRWVMIRNHIGWVRRATAEELQRAVDKKAGRLKSYISRYSKTVLLLVADRRYESGMLADGGSIALCNPGFFAIYFMSATESIARVG